MNNQSKLLIVNRLINHTIGISPAILLRSPAQFLDIPNYATSFYAIILGVGTLILWLVLSHLDLIPSGKLSLWAVTVLVLRTAMVEVSSNRR